MIEEILSSIFKVAEMKKTQTHIRLVRLSPEHTILNLHADA